MTDASEQTRKFYRTRIAIDVLSEEPLGDCLALSQVEYMIAEGGCVGGGMTSEETVLTSIGAARVLIEFGSDPAFFRLNEDGSDLDEDSDQA